MAAWEMYVIFPSRAWEVGRTKPWTHWAGVKAEDAPRESVCERESMRGMGGRGMMRDDDADGIDGMVG
jgi:hypothetical protein